MKKIGMIGIALVLMLSVFVSAHTEEFDSPQDIGDLNKMHNEMIKFIEPNEIGFHNQMHTEHVKAIATGEEFDCPMH